MFAIHIKHLTQSKAKTEDNAFAGLFCKTKAQKS